MDVLGITLDYGAEELSALNRLIGGGDAPGLDAPDPAPMSAETRRAVHAAAWRGLVARKALLIEPGPPPSFSVAEPHASVLAPLIAPERTITLDRWTPTGETRWTLYLREDAAVAQHALPGHLYRHTLFPRAQAAERLVAAAAIEPRPEAQGQPFEVSRTQLTAPRDEHSPAVLYAALSITRTEGLTWIDAGDLGLWHGTTRFAPITAEALSTQLSGLVSPR